MPVAMRRCAISLSAIVLSACVSIPTATPLCETSRAENASELAAEIDCPAAAVASRFQTVDGVQQRGGQTRTAGVPRSFLVTMLVLLVVFALA